MLGVRRSAWRGRRRRHRLGDDPAGGQCRDRGKKKTAVHLRPPFEWTRIASGSRLNALQIALFLWAQDPPSAAAAIGSDALIGNPDPLRRFTALPEYVDRHASAREPVAADSEPPRLEHSHEVLADAHRAIFMERAVIAEAHEIELQRLRFDDPSVRDIVDDQMGE